MEPIEKGQLKSVIASAYVLRLDTGETQMLITKGESYCHFFEPITIEDYKIVFRIDWSDLDTSGHPTLDADFYDIETNKKIPNNDDRHAAHHTKTKDPKVRIYEWEFKEAKRPFKVVACWITDVREEMQFSDDPSCCVVYRNGLRVDE